MSFSNVPISSPVFYPNLEKINMNGFAWTNKQGIVLQSDANTINNDWFSQGIQ